jgi:hypothetical protein
MHFSKITPAIAVAILAGCSEAAPFWSRSNETDPYAPTAGVTGTGVYTTTNWPVPTGTEGPATTGAEGPATTGAGGSGSTLDESSGSTYGGVPAPTSAPALPSGLSKTARILLSDTRADAINNVLTDDREDFVFDFGMRRGRNVRDGGEIVAANRATFPALTNQGIGMAVGFIGPCGFNTPHIHNRATELLIVTQGRVISEMVVENGVQRDGQPRNIMNEITEYQMTPFFQGSIHSQFNPTCEDVIFVAPQSAEDFGVSQVANNLFGLDDATLAATFTNFIDGAEVDNFRSQISVNVALGVEECLATCGIAKR